MVRGDSIMGRTKEPVRKVKITVTGSQVRDFLATYFGSEKGFLEPGERWEYICYEGDNSVDIDHFKRTSTNFDVHVAFEFQEIWPGEYH